jgi:hypothetical protein
MEAAGGTTVLIFIESIMLIEIPISIPQPLTIIWSNFILIFPSVIKIAFLMLLLNFVKIIVIVIVRLL